MNHGTMTDAEASAEAQRRWGSCAGTRRQKDGLCVVGTIGAMPGETAFGYGPTWEAAFDKADEYASTDGRLR